MPNQTVDDIFEAVVAAYPALRRVPVASYRVQLNPNWTFADARRIVPYLHELGMSDLYTSPYLKARPGSQHGYDICDHHQLNPELGSEDDYNQLMAELQRCGLGHIFDVVPNHMGIGEGTNLWWMDVLENGPDSPYAAFFDIEWKPLIAGPELEDRVLLPILGEPYGRILENQELRLYFEDGAFFIAYWENKLPVALHSYAAILRLCGERMAGTLPPDYEHLLELQSIITALNYLPARTEGDPEKVAERQREKEIVKRRLANLWQVCPEFRVALEETICLFNGQKGDPRSFDRLDRLLGEQAYRLAYWRVAAEEINFRRFFDVNHLAAIRMENPAVFREAHRLILALLRQGKVTGLRIDHIDGLWDPAGYLRQLQRSAFLELCRSYLCANPPALVPQPLILPPDQPAPGGLDAGQFDLPADGQPADGALEPGAGVGPGDWTEPLEALSAELLARFDERIESARSEVERSALYVVVEKILGKGESLPADWPVAGTTGYDFANAVNGIFVDSANRKAFDDLYASFTRNRIQFHNLVNSSKKMIMLVSLTSEINMLAFQLKRIAAKNRWYRDLTLNSLTFALREVMACLPVYRTYISGESDSVDERDREYIETAVAEAKKRNPRTAAAIFDFLQDILLLRYAENATEADRIEQRNFVGRFQQVTGPVMAKGLEDTAFYGYNRLTSLNEVGGDPAQFGLSVAAFHRQNVERQRRWPLTFLATSTHDSKRSEDIRARINVLSEIPQEWKAALTRWSRLNRRYKTKVTGQLAPDRNEEYLLYQTLLGAWPLERLDDDGYRAFVERIQDYLLKAVKEAKVNTSWINPNIPYEKALHFFISSALDREKPNPFLDDFAGLQRKVTHFGLFNALSQTLLKMTCPGVPDFYQGMELWNFTLVDPDNRRPVDYPRRMELLRELLGRQETWAGSLAALAQELVETKEDGRIKLYLTNRALRFRRAHAELFERGTYQPLDCAGSAAEHLCAFTRRQGDQAVVVAVPRLMAKLTGGAVVAPLGAAVWQESVLLLPNGLAGRPYRNLFTDERLTPIEHEGSAALRLGEVFQTFPAALLVQE